MNNPIAQLFLLVVLMAAAGTTYNVLNARNPQRHLKWVNTSLYMPGAYVIDAGEPAVPPAAVTSPGNAPPTAPSGATPPPPAAAGDAGSAAQQAAAIPPPPAPAADASDYTMITLAEAHEQLLSGTTFVDARRSREYEAGHIPTAISMSPWEDDLPAKIARLIEGGAVTEAPVVVYCGNSKECEDSKLVCRQLKIANFNNLLIYQGGFPEWSKEKPGLVATGKEPGALPASKNP